MKSIRQTVGLVLVLLLLVVLTIGAKESVQSQYFDLESSPKIEDPRAGIITKVSGMTIKSFDEVEIDMEEIEQSIPIAEKTEQEVDLTPTGSHPDWADKVMADVNDYLQVRSEPNRKSTVIARMMRGDVATLVSYNEDHSWIEISSGNVHGWVKASYCVVGDAAYEESLEDCLTYATLKTGGVRLRSGPSTESGIIKAMKEGNRLLVMTEYVDSTPEGWVPVKHGGKVAYISSDYVNVATEYDTILTLQEEQQALAAARKASGDGIATATQDQRETAIARYDEKTILGALVQVESGAENYECKLAVAAVVMNRVKSRTYPNTITEVIYQRGQFSTARISGILAKGVMKECLEAAQAAIDGEDNTDGAIGFTYASTGVQGVVYNKQVFFK